MYCSKCGKENKDNVKFCIQCGAPLTDSSPSPEKTPDRIILKIILAGILVAVSAVSTVTFLSVRNTKSREPDTIQETGRTPQKLSGPENTSGSDKNPGKNGQQDTGSLSPETKEEAAPDLYAFEYGQILREYLDGKRGASYGMSMEFDGLHLDYNAKVGLNPQTGRFEYYFAFYDGNQDGEDELYVSSCPSWWTNQSIAEGIYSCIDGNLVISLDRSDMSEYNNYYTFVKDMNLKIEERSGGSYHSYQKLNSQGTLDEISCIYWSASDHFLIDDREVSEEEANAQDALLGQPPQIQWLPVTEDNIRLYFSAPRDGQQISQRPPAPSKAAIDPYAEDMDRLMFWGSSDTFYDSGIPLSIEDKGDYFELSGITVVRKVYLDTEQVNRLRPGDTLNLCGATYTLSTIEKYEDSYIAAPWYSISLSGPPNEIHSLIPTKDGRHYTIEQSSDDPLTETIYTGSLWVRKDGNIMGFHPVSYDIGTYNAADYLSAMKNTNMGYISAMNFRVDKDGYVIIIEGQIAG